MSSRGGSRLGAAVLLAFAVGGALPVHGQATNGAYTIGIFRPQGGLAIWYADSNGTHNWEPSDAYYFFGLTGDIPVMGDWTFTGQRRMGIFRDGYWYVDTDDSRSWSGGDSIFAFGLAGDQPLTINGTDGYLHLAVFRPSEGALYVDTSYCNCYSGATVRYQIYNTQPGDIALMVNPDGQGGRLAFWRPSTGTWYLGPLGAWGNFSFDLNSAVQYQYGLSGDLPVAGDWTGSGSGVWNIGVFRGQQGIWIVDSNGSHAYEGSDAVYAFGVPGDIPVMGPWASVTVPITVTSNPPGLQMAVDGATCTAPCSFQWTPGYTHTIGVSSPQSGGAGTQYIYSSWSDGSAQTHTITVPSSSATYTAYFTTNPLTIGTSSPLPGGTVGAVYSQSLSATGGTLPYNWSVASGTLPPGLSLFASGVLSGSPTAAGSYSFTVRVTDAASASSTKQFSITITAVTYQLTTAVYPSGAGTVSPACGSGCWYNSGTVVTITASNIPNSGYQFANFSGGLSGLSPSQNVTMNGPLAVTANFVPTVWKGINYSPRQHSLWRMFYDWDAYNLGPVIDADLAKLSQAGFNMIHLYVWDQTVFQGVTMSQPVCGSPEHPTTVCYQGIKPGEAAGFIGPDGDPAQSPHNQWAHLEDFVAKARDHGIFVVIDLTSAWISGHAADFTLDSASTDMIDSRVVTPYSNWVNRFVQQLGHYQNVLAWSSYFGLGFAANVTTDTSLTPGPNFSKYTYIFAKLYQAIDQASRQCSPAPGALGLVAAAYLADFSVDTSSKPIGSVSEMILRGSGYTYKVSNVQQIASAMRTLLNQLYPPPKDPDLYFIPAFHPNSWDLYNALYGLTHGSFPIPSSKIVVTEWGTSSSLGPNSSGVPFYGNVSDPATGNGYPTYGDSITPTMTAPGQSAWIQNTLCAFRDAGIQKQAYWWLYDPYTLVSTPPWSMAGGDLAWWGYWGVAYEEPAVGNNGNKPAWTVLQQYYRDGMLNCPIPDFQHVSVYNASPILSLTPTSPYYTVNQPVRATWTASDISGLSSPGASGTLTCDTEVSLSSTLQAASCASSDWAPSANTGSYTVTVTAVGTNGNPANQATASGSVTIGMAPLLNAVTSSSPPTPISSAGWMILWGQGFANEKQNSIQCIRSGYADVWLNDSDGIGFSYESNTQINVNLANRLAPGTWTLKVWNGWSGTSSNSYQVTIQP